MRHAKVLIKKRNIYANEIKSVVEEYDQTVIDNNVDNLDELKKVVDEVDFFVSSGLRRSVDSLALLGKEANYINKLFAEVKDPHFSRKFIKLPLYTWIAISKLLWRFGYSGGNLSYRKSREEAFEASKLLIEFAKEQGSVLLLGHGMKNRLIVKALKKQGWSERKKLSMKNWGYGVYEYSFG